MIKVLLVDDELLEREAFKSIVNDINDTSYSVVGEASDGETAVRLSIELEPDILFIAEKLPGLQGAEAIKRIKKQNMNIVVYLMYAFSDRDPEAIGLLADGKLSKPIRSEDIERVFKKYKHENTERILLTKGGLLEQLLKEIYLENYKKAKDQLVLIMEHHMAMQSSMKDLQKTAETIVDSILKICDAKGIRKYIPNRNWLEGLTIHNALQWFEEILREVFQAIAKHLPLTTQNEIQMVLNYIELHYMDNISLEDVADFVNLSPSYVSRLFKQEVKTTFVNYVTGRKVEHAKKLLQYTEVPVIQIALKLSYQEHTYFSKVFKKVVGVTPTEYRNKFQEKRLPY